MGLIKEPSREIILPNQWAARNHQSPFMRAMAGGRKRACLVWHRRAGKDSSALNFTCVEAHRKIANYWHMLPTAKQARKVVWENVNPHTGIKVIDQVFPEEIRAGVNNTDMTIDLKCGSQWQLCGSDNYDSLVGSAPYGVVFSEYSIADPRAWDFIRPILRENGGWAIFIYTPRGKNHGHRLFEMAKNNPEWFAQILTIDDTVREDGSPIITEAGYQEELNSGMDIQLARQEYYCSFDAGLFGAYYTNELKLAKYGEYPWNPRKPVHTFWDIGLKDATSIWFGQENDGYIDIIDYESSSNVSFDRWIKELREKPYIYGINGKPHDFKKRDWKDGKSADAVARDFNWQYELIPDIPRSQGIDAVKAFLPRCRFNVGNPRVQTGVDGLANYRREYNDKLQVFMDRPLHDWASNPADGFRYMSIGWPDDYQLYNSIQHKVIPAVGSSRRITKRPR